MKTEKILAIGGGVLFLIIGGLTLYTGIIGFDIPYFYGPDKLSFLGKIILCGLFPAACLMWAIGIFSTLKEDGDA